MSASDPFGRAAAGQGHAEVAQKEEWAPLRTLPSWHLLSASSLALVEDAMAFLDQDSAAVGTRMQLPSGFRHPAPHQPPCLPVCFMEAAKLLDRTTVSSISLHPKASDAGGRPTTALAPSPVPGGQRLGPTPAAPSCKRKRASLDEKSAVEIFLAKRTMRGARSGLSRRLADKYGVTAKAVRDVWVMRTWTNATKQYWSDAEQMQKLRSSTSPD